ncbi:MAG: TRAP transporter large permease [Sedimentisphaerales bacterium]|nr:TRAP transporter large permease [Sedimentisphaerales bacterium]
MTPAIAILIVVFVLLLVLNVPVAFCMGLAALLGFVVMGDMPSLMTTAHKMATGIDEFALLAIPFFILSGLFMGHGGIARRLIDFANVLVGGFRGGLAFVNIFTCMLFGSISGSAAAAVSSVGGFMVPLMNKMGYHRDYNASVSITAATTGLLIPPSNVMIVYSLATGGATSIAAIFIAGVIPGIMVGLGLMIAAGILAARHKYGSEDLFKLNEIIIRMVGTTLCLVIPIVLILYRGQFGIPEKLLALTDENAVFRASLRTIHIWTVSACGLLAVLMLIINIVLFLIGMSKEKRIIMAGLLGLQFLPILLGKGYFIGQLYDGGDRFSSTSLILVGYSFLITVLVLWYGIKISWKGFIVFVQAIPALMLIVIVLGGILAGVFTATEASAIAVVYAFLLSVFLYREVKWKEIPDIILKSAVTTAVVLMLVATSMAMSSVMTLENVPQNVSATLTGLTQNPYVLLLIINIMLLIVGTFMDMTPAVLIFTPIFLPIVSRFVGFEMDPLHFGIILIMNLCIGLCTPPVGTCLFLGCGIAETTVTKVIRHILPFFAAMITVLMICTYLPAFSMWLPDKLGLIEWSGKGPGWPVYIISILAGIAVIAVVSLLSARKPAPADAVN